MFAPRHTLLIVSAQVLARIDIAGARALRVKQIWVDRPGDSALTTGAIRALKLSSQRAGLVTVICPELWTDILSLPLDVVSIASKHELHQALALEAEIDSGICAFDSKTGAIRLAADDRQDSQWCVTQITESQIGELSAQLRANAAKLRCAAHPMAAEFAKDERMSADDAKKRLELWKAGMDEAGVQSLASKWAEFLTLGASSPMLLRAGRESQPRNPLLIGAALAIVSVSGCGLWHWRNKTVLSSAKRSIEQLENQQNSHAELVATLKITESRLALLRKEVSTAQALRQATERQLQLAAVAQTRQNMRCSALFDALADAAQDCWVQRLESTASQTIVHGIATDNATAHAFAGRLEALLIDKGWKTAPASTSPTHQDLVAFKIALTVSGMPNELNNHSAITSDWPSKNGSEPSLGALASREQP